MNNEQCCHQGHGQECHTRKYLTKAEQLDMLKKYQTDLTNELQAVQEKIKELNA